MNFCTLFFWIPEYLNTGRMRGGSKMEHPSSWLLGKSPTFHFPYIPLEKRSYRSICYKICKYFILFFSKGVSFWLSFSMKVFIWKARSYPGRFESKRLHRRTINRISKIGQGWCNQTLPHLPQVEFKPWNVTSCCSIWRKGGLRKIRTPQFTGQ